MPFDAAPLCTVTATALADHKNGDTSTGTATGATLLTAVVAYYAGLGVVSSLVDNVGNILTARATYGPSTSSLLLVIYDCSTITHAVGAGWKLTIASSANTYPSVIGQAWKSSAASPFDDKSGTFNNAATALAPGSKTPSEGGCLIITGLTQFDTAGAAANVNGGFTKTNCVAVSGSAIGGSLGYLVQPATPAASNPSWTIANATEMIAGQVIYKSNAPPVTGDGGGSDQGQQNVLNGLWLSGAHLLHG